MKYNLLIIFCIFFLGLLSIAVVGSVANDILRQHVFNYVLGIILLFLVAKIDIRAFSSWGFVFFIISIIFLVVTFFIGEQTRGSVRWISIAGFNLQSSEIAKPLLIVFLAAYAKKWKFLAFLLPLLLVFKQPDLGSTLILIAIGGMFILYSGISGKVLVAIGLIIMAIIPFGWNFLKDYQKERFIIFLNPSHDPMGSGYNALQAMIAVGNGGLMGLGLGRGTQSHLRFLPERHTDFIFASYAEEFGFVGVICLLAIYLLLLWQLLVIAEHCEDTFGKLVVLGVFALLFSQVFINIGMNVGLLPITGITLPLMSYGGSSLITIFLALGMVLSIDRGNKSMI